MALLTTCSDPTGSHQLRKLLFERRDGLAFLSGVEMARPKRTVTSPFMHVTKGAASRRHCTKPQHGRASTRRSDLLPRSC